MRARVLPSLLSLLALLAAVASGCGTTGNENADPAEALPADSLLSVTATIRPEGKQKDALEAAATKIGQIDDPGERVKRYVDDQLESAKLSYQDDIEPWLGRKAGVGVLPARAGVVPQPVVLLASKDNDAARDALNKGADNSPGSQEITYKDVKYHRERGGSAEGVVGNYVVLGTDAAVRQVIDVTKGAPSLDDSANYKQTTGKLASSDRIAEAYADGPAIAAAASASNTASGTAFAAAQIRRLLPGPAAAGLSISDTKILVDGASVARGPAPTGPTGADVIASLPDDAWLALGVAGIRDGIRGSRLPIDLSWLRTVAVYAGGTSPLTLKAAIIAATSDRGASERFIRQIAPIVARQVVGSGGKVVPLNDGGVGFGIETQQIPIPIEVRAGPQAVTVSLGSPPTSDGTKLTDSPDYKQAASALGGGVAPSFMLTVQPLLTFAGAALGSNPTWQKAVPYLQTLSYVAAGTKLEGSTRVSRLAIGLR